MLNPIDHVWSWLKPYMKRQLNENREDLLKRERTDGQLMLRIFMLEVTDRLDNQMIINYFHHVVAYYGDFIEEKDMKY